ncbi:MAG TPA: tRNA lysidine(34) synthetase TilS [Solirubrobacteraceae bacterium]|nr:tRNA lysidine(34) synthetase TilS [Solirubrobacteraceae bacterium]
MSELVESILERVRASGLLVQDARYLALVSGGRDSVCLLDVLVQICGAGAVSVLHVNYGLRGVDSDADERHVAMICSRVEIALHVRRAPAPPDSGNLQAWARDVRYGEARLLARASEANVATGHTASDQAETVLYRLAASPGRRALLGMAPRDGLLIRPLLGLTREETAAYCRARGLDWREDATNADERFARVRVRRGLLEELRRVHPAAEANLNRSVELLREEAAVLDRLVARALAGRSKIALAELTELEPALARLVVVRLAEDAGGALVPGVGARVSELLALAPGGGSGQLDVGGGVRAIVEYGVLRFEPVARARDGPSAVNGRDVALAVPGRVCFGDWTVESELRALPGKQALDCRVADGSVGVLDADQLDLSALSVREWRPGDRMRPVGLIGSKTVADLFGDRRLPRAERSGMPVIACADEVVWVPGVATASRARLRSETTRVALLTARRA